jgi:hypothetical protein
MCRVYIRAFAPDATRVSVLSGDGYFVFFPNSRGSCGQNRAFKHANFRISAASICGSTGI